MAVDNGRSVAAALRAAADRLTAAGVEDARLEAEALLRHALGAGVSRAQLLARASEPLEPTAAAAFEVALARRLRREPLAYITGSCEFYGLDIECSPAALIPRPESEHLVELALDWLCDAAPESPLIVDAGTGTGVLAVAIAVNAPDASVVAIDSSRETLRLARRNVARHGVAARVSLVAGDLLGPLRAGVADVIVANLPYVAEAEWDALQPEIREHEPRGALVGGARGTETIERLLAQARGALRPRSLLLCEIGATQGRAVETLAHAALPGSHIEIRKDMAGLDRVLFAGLGTR
jgi:release factor glutamine methyltransferase